MIPRYRLFFVGIGTERRLSKFVLGGSLHQVRDLAKTMMLARAECSQVEVYRNHALMCCLRREDFTLVEPVVWLSPDLQARVRAENYRRLRAIERAVEGRRFSNQENSYS